MSPREPQLQHPSACSLGVEARLEERAKPPPEPPSVDRRLTSLAPSWPADRARRASSQGEPCQRSRRGMRGAAPDLDGSLGGRHHDCQEGGGRARRAGGAELGGGETLPLKIRAHVATVDQAAPLPHAIICVAPARPPRVVRARGQQAAIAASNRSAGRCQPSVLRGRWLISAVTRVRSSTVCIRSVPFGK